MLRLLHGSIHLLDLRTRLPFKYGIATMTRAPQAFVRMVVEINGREQTGIAADLLPPKWFTKIPDKPLEAEIDEMLSVIEHAVAAAVGLTGETAFEVWQQVRQRQDRWGREQDIPSLLSNFGTTFVERAVIEAVCKAAAVPFATAARDNLLGLRLAECHPQLARYEPRDLLPVCPRRTVIARHTVGMADPLTDAEIAPADRLDDGLPQSLTACIRRYGLEHFKIKLCGDLARDRDRLARVTAVLRDNAPESFRFTLDGNEQFRSLDAFRDDWQSLTGTAGLRGLFARLMFVEQPFHRDVALDPAILADLRSWTARPPLIIDESDAELDSLPRALDLGYHGTSHKNCKGIFKSIANACLLEHLRGAGFQPASPEHGSYILSGEDLANIGPVALLQDLAVAATLGVESIERNGHHYFAGLSAFPPAVQQQILKHHPDLYEPSPAGWPTLAIRNGRLDLASVVEVPLGVGFDVDVQHFTPAGAWRKEH
jgi:hypothetical protein